MQDELKQLRAYRNRLALLLDQCDAAIIRRMEIPFMFKKTYIPIPKATAVKNKSRKQHND